MAATKKEELLEQLRAEEQRLQREQSDADTRRQQIRKELTQVRAAVRALEGKTRRKQPAAKISDAELTSIIETALRGRLLSEQALKDAIDERLPDQVSRRGLHLKIKAALKDPRFTKHGDGYRLTNDRATVPNPVQP